MKQTIDLINEIAISIYNEYGYEQITKLLAKKAENEENTNISEYAKAYLEQNLDQASLIPWDFKKISCEQHEDWTVFILKVTIVLANIRLKNHINNLIIHKAKHQQNTTDE
jgi:hypothetical protein